jgi:hypothetical protein
MQIQGIEGDNDTAETPTVWGVVISKINGYMLEDQVSILA